MGEYPQLGTLHSVETFPHSVALCWSFGGFYHGVPEYGYVTHHAATQHIIPTWYYIESTISREVLIIDNATHTNVLFVTYPQTGNNRNSIPNWDRRSDIYLLR